MKPSEAAKHYWELLETELETYAAVGEACEALNCVIRKTSQERDELHKRHRRAIGEVESAMVVASENYRAARQAIEEFYQAEVAGVIHRGPTPKADKDTAVLDTSDLPRN